MQKKIQEHPLNQYSFLGNIELFAQEFKKGGQPLSEEKIKQIKQMIEKLTENQDEIQELKKEIEGLDNEI